MCFTLARFLLLIFSPKAAQPDTKDTKALLSICVQAYQACRYHVQGCVVGLVAMNLHNMLTVLRKYKILIKRKLVKTTGPVDLNLKPTFTFFRIQFLSPHRSVLFVNRGLKSIRNSRIDSFSQYLIFQL